jgi:Flp pilus assembly pilin Flp
MARVFVACTRLIRNDAGQDLLEYGLVAVLVAIAAVLAVKSVGDTLYTLWWEPIARAL